ncbi:MAG: response regulator [Ignavibacteriae bacterium]|nr:response regulator [Ignavibacteriota bacterium]
MDILLVDDNTDYLFPMKEALYAHGYTVYAADDGLQACKIMSAAKVDLIISDIKMPNFDGIRLHKYARELKQYAKTKFVFISGYRDQYSHTLEMNPDQDYFLDKTMAAQEIVKFVDRLMFGKFAEVWV